MNCSPTMITLRKISIFMSLFILQATALWEEIAGPYDITLLHLSHCEKRGLVEFFEPMKAKKFNRTHFSYTGIFKFGVDFDDGSNMKIVASNKGTNGRYNNVIDIEMNTCDIKRKFGMKIAKSIEDHCNISVVACPMKNFTCKMRNWIMDYEFQNIPALPYGEYRVDASLLKLHKYGKKELISCLRLYGMITPKKPKLDKNKNSSSINNTKI